MRIGAALALGLAPLTLSACALNSYADIPRQAGAADPQLQALAARARSGDDRAQLDLGIRYEEGRGVPVDLGRARDLYYEAMTQPSRRATTIYVPTPGGARSSIVRTFRAPPEESQLDEASLNEAYLRWRRLMPVAKEPAGGAPAGRKSAAAATAVVDQAYQDEPPDPEVAREIAVRDYAYSPIFPTSPGTPWRRAVSRHLRTHFLDARGLDDSFLFFIDRAAIVEPGARPDGAAVGAFCREVLAAPADGWGQVEVRVFSLCLARLGKGDPAEHRRRLNAARGALARYPAEEFGFAVDTVDDRVLLARAGLVCNCDAGTDQLLIEAAREMLRSRTIMNPCRNRRCRERFEFLDSLSRHAAYNLYLGYLAHPAAPVWGDPALNRILAVDGHWTLARLSRFAETGRDESLVEQCAMLGQDYARCRQTFYAGPALLPAAIFAVAEFASTFPADSRRCATLNARISHNEPELRFRQAILDDFRSLSMEACRR